MSEPVRRARFKAEDWEREFPLPPEPIRLRFIDLMISLTSDWRTVVELRDHERRFRREIIRWIMGDPHGGRAVARRSLPTGYVVHAWVDERQPDAIVLMRTR